MNQTHGFQHLLFRILNICLLVEVVEEGGDALEGRFALAFNLNLEVDFHLGNATEVLNIVELSGHAHTTSSDHRLTEAHLVHAIVHQHRDVVDLNNLSPKIWKNRKGEIAVSDGALEWAFLLSALHVHMNPLVVESGIGELVDTVLVDFEPF